MLVGVVVIDPDALVGLGVLIGLGISVGLGVLLESRVASGSQILVVSGTENSPSLLGVCSGSVASAYLGAVADISVGTVDISGAPAGLEEGDSTIKPEGLVLLPDLKISVVEVIDAIIRQHIPYVRMRLLFLTLYLNFMSYRIPYTPICRNRV